MESTYERAVKAIKGFAEHCGFDLNQVVFTDASSLWWTPWGMKQYDAVKAGYADGRYEVFDCGLMLMHPESAVLQIDLDLNGKQTIPQKYFFF